MAATVGSSTRQRSKCTKHKKWSSRGTRSTVRTAPNCSKVEMTTSRPTSGLTHGTHKLGSHSASMEGEEDVNGTGVPPEPRKSSKGGGVALETPRKPAAVIYADGGSEPSAAMVGMKEPAEPDSNDMGLSACCAAGRPGALDAPLKVFWMEDLGVGSCEGDMNVELKDAAVDEQSSEQKRPPSVVESPQNAQEPGASCGEQPKLIDSRDCAGMGAATADKQGTRCLNSRRGIQTQFRDAPSKSAHHSENRIIYTLKQTNGTQEARKHAAVMRKQGAVISTVTTDRRAHLYLQAVLAWRFAVQAQ